MKALLNKTKDFFLGHHSRTTLVLISAALTFCVLMIAFAARRFAPFGDRSLIAMDAYGQYFPMLRGMREALHSGSGFEFSFFGCCGFDLWVQNAYYTNSPLWIPLYFLPEKMLPWAVDLTVALRISLASATFCIWIMRNKRKDTLFAVIFSLCYGLCGWALAFMNQFMWADVYVLLPIVVLGIERIFLGRSPVLYTLSLGLVLWSNFYIGFMVCVFSVLWFGLLFFSKKLRARQRIKFTLRFALGSLLAGGLAAAVLIPTFLALEKTAASTLGFEGELRLYHSFSELFSRLLPLQKTALAYEAPNLYCGLLCVPLGLCCFFSKRISTSRKVIYSLLCAFMLLSFELNLLDYFWHGFHYPNQLPGRQSFIFCFLLVTAAHRGYLAISSGELEIKTSKLTPVLKRSLVVSFALVLCAELAVNTFWTVGTQVWGGDLTKYTSLDSDMNKVLKKYSPGYGDFFRSEMLAPQKNNSGSLYGYNGITYYSSTMSADAYRLFKGLKMPVYAKNVSTKYVPDAVCNALFGVRYLFDTGAEADSLSLYGLSHTESIGSIDVYVNKWALPIGFYCSPEIRSFDPNSEKTKEATMNALLKSTGATDRNVYYRDGDQIMLNTDEFDLAFDKLLSGGMRLKSFSSTRISGTISPEEDGIIFFSIPDNGGWKVSIDGKDVPTEKAMGYFLTADVTAGEHSVLLTYRTPGLNTGLVITVFSAGITVIMLSAASKRKGRKHKKL